MDLQLVGLRALVTGSSSGIGVGIARVLALEGVRILVHGRDAERANQVARSIVASGGQAGVALGDLSTDAGATAVAAEALRQFGGIDILVNNAGGKTTAGNPSWFDIPWKDWLGTFEQNVGAAVRLVHALVPGMQARGFGRVVNISSAAATQPEKGLGEYQAAKAAMTNLSVGLARSLSNTGITVNTVSPGTILTPAVERWLGYLAQQHHWGDDPLEIERRYTSEYMQLCVARLGRPEDIGRVVALLASPLSNYITGANYRIDGGQIRAIN